jgi:hypothetical protein
VPGAVSIELPGNQLVDNYTDSSGSTSGFLATNDPCSCIGRALPYQAVGNYAAGKAGFELADAFDARYRRHSASLRRNKVFKGNWPVLLCRKPLQDRVHFPLACFWPDGCRSVVSRCRENPLENEASGRL